MYYVLLEYVLLSKYTDFTDTICIISDGASGFSQRFGADHRLSTTSRYLAVLKCARLMGPNQEEVFVERSQSYASAKPVRIVRGKEDHSFLHEMLRSLQGEAKELKLFDVNFKGRNIKVRFSKPKYIADGKGFLNYLSVTGAYCYLCTLTVAQGQESWRCDHGMKINRSVKKVRQNFERLMKTVKGNLKAYKDLPTDKRDGGTNDPIALSDDVMNHYNLASQHVYGHLWKFGHDLIIQHNTRLYTWGMDMEDD